MYEPLTSCAAQFGGGVHAHVSLQQVTSATLPQATKNDGLRHYWRAIGTEKQKIEPCPGTDFSSHIRPP